MPYRVGDGHPWCALRPIIVSPLVMHDLCLDLDTMPVNVCVIAYSSTSPALWLLATTLRSNERVQKFVRELGPTNERTNEQTNERTEEKKATTTVGTLPGYLLKPPKLKTIKIDETKNRRSEKSTKAKIEAQEVGKLESWKVGSWKVGKLESSKVDKLKTVKL